MKWKCLVVQFTLFAIAFLESENLKAQSEATQNQADLCLDGPPAIPFVAIETVRVGIPFNVPNSGGHGRVDYAYRIGKYEVTNAQYVDFLNAVARGSDPQGLFHPAMASQAQGGIRRIQCPFGYLYVAKPHFAQKPVNYVSWPSAARFANWLHNNQPVGEQRVQITETGVYDLSLGSLPGYLEAVRGSGARYALPTKDEWIKAAKYCPGCAPAYWAFSTRSNDNPSPGSLDLLSSALWSGEFASPSSNSANYGGRANWNGSSVGNVTSVGSAGSPSPWGTFDQDGNVAEWNEQVSCMAANACGRKFRGGSYRSSVGQQLGPNHYLESGLLEELAPMASYSPDWPYPQGSEMRMATVGFRIVQLIVQN